MGAFNVLRAFAQCPSCKERVLVRIQFKYGNTWQFVYELGDQLRWGGNSIGVPGKKLVVVDGVAEDVCSACGYGEEWNLYVYVEEDRLTRVETENGPRHFVGGESFTILAE
jgi:hypothetical protein